MVVFLTPLAGFVALGALLPLATALVRERRLRRVRRSLGLAPPPTAHVFASALAASAAVALLGLAAAQPAIARSNGLRARTDAQGYLVLDDSRSMAAVTRRGGANRLERARRLALALRDAVPELPWGVASFTDRTLVHAFPSTHRETVADTLAQAIGIQRPPPAQRASTATALGTLAQTAVGGFYGKNARRRVLVAFTDGESAPFSARTLVSRLRKQHVRLVLVRLWTPGDRVFDSHGRDLGYRPDPGSTASLQSLAAAGVDVVSESDAAGLPALTRKLIGSGPTTAAEAPRRLTTLAPAAVLAACLPLAFALLRTRR